MGSSSFLREVMAEKSNFEGKAGYEELGRGAGSQVREGHGTSLPPGVARDARAPRAGGGPGRDDRREEAVQTCLFGKEDFRRWAEGRAGVGLVEVDCGTSSSSSSTIRRWEGVFSGWT
ncbi:hypothetical protein ACHAWF_007647 [Thalassiosira exigua]